MCRVAEVIPCHERVTKWDYRVMQMWGSAYPEGVLRDYGNEGWELVSATIEHRRVSEDRGETHYIFILKRPVGDPANDPAGST